MYKKLIMKIIIVFSCVYFFHRRFPIPVSLKKVNLKKEIDKVLNCSFMTLGHGSCR